MLTLVKCFVAVRLALEKSVYSVEDFELDPLSASTVEGKPLYSIGLVEYATHLT